MTQPPTDRPPAVEPLSVEARLKVIREKAILFSGSGGGNCRAYEHRWLGETLLGLLSEYQAINVRVESDRASEGEQPYAGSPLERIDDLAVQREKATSAWNMWNEACHDIDAQRREVAALREAIQKAIRDAERFAVNRQPFPTFWLSTLRAALASSPAAGGKEKP